MNAYEINFDGLVGPTHNYAGLAYGNLASTSHGLTVSNPKSALHQGLEKMKLMTDLGVKQAILPPHERPNIRTLYDLGFRGSDSEIIQQAGREAPHILAACYSASSMWTANAATISPSSDTTDGKVHFTPANLISFFHRYIESRFTGKVLKAIFNDESAFAHHRALPGAAQFTDEGAANHNRLCTDYGNPGIELFVYGRRAFGQQARHPMAFPARQTLEASSAIARLHMLQPAATLFALQNPDAIDAGVFHNDVISVANQNVLFYHSLAFAEPVAVLDKLERAFFRYCGVEPVLIEVTADRVSLSEAVQSYLFNSQLVTLSDGTMGLISPLECTENERIAAFLEALVAEDNPISKVTIVDIRQSMKNGGGPACLRLRVVLNERELDKLNKWADRHYRDRLHSSDLVDPQLLTESRTALDELTRILDLGSIYDFQSEI
jgi:succinylarginine dihydrolase